MAADRRTSPIAARWGAVPSVSAGRRAVLRGLAASTGTVALSASGRALEPGGPAATAYNAGIAIRYVSVGAGLPIVLLHGFSDSLESWDALGYVAPLRRDGHRVILIDARGHGGSERPHDIPAYAPELRAGDVVAVLDALDVKRASVFGYSMGGWSALNVARFYPDRVDCLIVGGCHPFGQSMALHREAVGDGIDPWVRILERLGGPLDEALRARILANDPAALRAAVADDRLDISAALAGFDRPALFYAGTADPLHDTVARCADFFPRGRFTSLPGCNHLTALLRADLILPQVRAFLSASAG